MCTYLYNKINYNIFSYNRQLFAPVRYTRACLKKAFRELRVSVQKGIASMNINECYQAMGADYEEVFGRLRNEKLIAKFVLKFPDDPSFSQLKNSLAEKNTKEAFRAAHTLKGVAQNLGFTPLYETAAAITEVLRTGNLPDGESMMNAVTKEYERTIAAIVQLDA